MTYTKNTARYYPWYYGVTITNRTEPKKAITPKKKERTEEKTTYNNKEMTTKKY